ncbi:hypothetical protein HDZ31DRAFT_44896 [Schizophyllum fasciatum]
MSDLTVPAPVAPKPSTVILRSDLERRLRKESKAMPHIFHGLLIHSLWPGGYSREALSSTSEFVQVVKQHVVEVEASLRASLPDVLLDRFQLIYRFGAAYRRLWKERQEEASDTPPLEEWAEEDAQRQGGMRDDECTAVHFHVGADLAKTLTLHARTYMEVFIVGNVLRQLVAKGLDPSNASLWVRLPNGSVMNISWYDSLPVPAPPFERVIHLELRSRAWRAQATLSHRSTGRHLLCAFYNQFSNTPHFFHLPIMEGSWLELSQARSFLIKNGIDKDKRSTIILHGSSVNPSCQLEMTWDDPIPLPPGNEFAIVFRLVCRDCLMMEPLRTICAKAHFCNRT